MHNNCRPKRNCTTNAQHFAGQAIGTVTSGVTYTMSMFVKSSYSSIIIYTNSSEIISNVTVDTVNGTMSGATPNKISDAGNGWWYVQWTKAAQSTNTTKIYLVVKDLNSYTGSTSNFTEYFGVQLEAQSQATPFLKSSGVNAVRKATTTNLITYSNSNGLNFTFDNVSMTYNSIVSPDGLTNGILFEQTGTNSSNSAYNYSLTTADGTYTYSIFIKAKDSTSVRLYQSSGSAVSQNFNPQTMLAGVISGSLNLNFEDIGNGWFRVSFTRTLASASTHRFSIYPDRTNNQKGVYIFGLQVELQTQAEAYAKTTGLPVTIDLFKENNYGTTQGGVIQKDVPRNS